MNVLDKDLKNEVLLEITPTQEEIKELKILVNKFRDIIYDSAKKLDYTINIELGGSYAKNTFLRGDFDVDFFIQFEPNVEDSKKEKMLIEILHYSNIQFNIKHGSRVYVSGFFSDSSLNNFLKNNSKQKVSGFNFECVPTEICNNVKFAKNSTDVSIFHVKYLQNNSNKDANLVNEIRLTKKWFKTKHLYGAESYINGFSGHSIECLIMKFKSFENLIIFMSSMNKNQILEIDSVLNSKISFPKDKQSPLMMKDPILEGRNTLSALNEELFYRAKYYAIKHLVEGFEKKDFICCETNKNIEELESDFFQEKMDHLGIKYTFSKTELSRDILGSKLLKLTKKISKFLNEYGFNVLDIHFKIYEEENCAFAKIIIESSILPKQYLTKAISLDVLQKHIMKFLEIHKNSELKIINNYIYLEKERNFSNLEEFSNLYLSNKNNFKNKLDMEEFSFVNNIYFRI